MDPYISHRLPIGSPSFLFEVRSSLLWATGVKCCSHTWATLICRPFPTSPLCPFLPEWEALLSSFLLFSVSFPYTGLFLHHIHKYKTMCGHTAPPKQIPTKFHSCLNTYIYIYMCTCIHILYFTFCYIYLFPLKLTYLQICMLYRLICTYIYTYLQTCFCMHKRVYICTFYIFPANTRAYVYYNITFLHESIYVYIYIYTLCMWYVFERAWFLSANVKMDLLTPRWKSSLAIWSEAPMLWSSLWSVMLLSLSWVA